jgi:AcrR family transcriptional regulator
MDVEKEPIQQIPSLQTKDILLEAAIAEFNENGYFNTSVDTITRRAGVSHGTFYLYFKNKQKVLSVLIDQIEEKISIIVKDKNEDADFLNSKNFITFEQDIRQIVSVILESSGLFKAFVQGMVHNKEIFDLFARISHTIGDVLSARIKQKQIEGAGTRVDALILSQIMSIMFYMTLFIHSLGIIQCDPDVLTRHISTILFSVLNFDEKLMKAKKKKSEVRKAALIKTRKELINMAREEFSRHGYFDTKIADIAQKAGYSRGTFYQYFTDKDDIIQAIQSDMFYQNRDQTSIVDFIVTNLDATLLEELMRISTLVLDLFDKYSSFSWTLLQGAFYSEKLSRFYGQMFIQFSEPIQEKILEQQQDGACQGLDPLITAEIILTTVSYSIFMFFGGLIHCSREVFSDNMGIFLYSMLNYVNGQEK